MVFYIPRIEFNPVFVVTIPIFKTIELIKEYRAQDQRYCYVDFSRNFGKEIAMMAGLDYATGDCVIFIDADLQDPPELIPELIKYWEEGYDDVWHKSFRDTSKEAMKVYIQSMKEKRN